MRATAKRREIDDLTGIHNSLMQQTLGSTMENVSCSLYCHSSTHFTSSYGNLILVCYSIIYTTFFIEHAPFDENTIKKTIDVLLLHRKDPFAGDVYKDGSVEIIEFLLGLFNGHPRFMESSVVNFKEKQKMAMRYILGDLIVGMINAASSHKRLVHSQKELEKSLPMLLKLFPPMPDTEGSKKRPNNIIDAVKFLACSTDIVDVELKSGITHGSRLKPVDVCSNGSSLVESFT